MKKLIPLMAVLVLASAPANAMSVKDAATKTVSFAHSLVSKTVDKAGSVVKAVAGLGQTAVHNSLVVVDSATKAGQATVESAADTASDLAK